MISIKALGTAVQHGRPLLSLSQLQASLCIDDTDVVVQSRTFQDLSREQQPFLMEETSKL